VGLRQLVGVGVSKAFYANYTLGAAKSRTEPRPMYSNILPLARFCIDRWFFLVPSRVPDAAARAPAKIVRGYRVLW